jgi:hypothetical protein
MVRRPVFWAAFAVVAAIFCLSAAPAGAQAGLVSWILLGGKGKPAKVAGLQLFAESGNLDHSILYRNNGVTWSNGFVVSDEECPDEHFHGRIGDLKENGRGCGLGTVVRYEDALPAVQLGSDALMANAQASLDLSNVHYRDAVAAAQLSAVKLAAMKVAVQNADPSQLPGARVALPSVNAAIAAQDHAVEILVNLAELTNSRHAIRRAEVALRQAENASRKAFTILVNR